VDVRRPAAGSIPRSTSAATTLLLALAAAGCGHSGSDAPPQVTVHIGSDAINLEPTQYCADGTGHRYGIRPPIVQAAPDTQVVFTVPDVVATRGWEVQVFDQTLQKRLGSVSVAKGSAVFNEITTSDVVPPAFYLVVVEDKGAQCDRLSGAWPLGIIRASGVPTFSSTPAPSSSSSPG
jgi:hypothetical protein